MFRSLNTAATGMAAEETKLDTIANNLANANTTGYKKQDAEFEDLLYQNVRGAQMNGGQAGPTQVQIGAGSRVVATPRSFAQGTLQQTGNPTDLAIEGDGFFGVTKPNGEVAYTRNGNLKIDAQGRMTTSDGLPLEPPITVPPNATNLTVASDGTVTVTTPGQTQPQQLGQIQLVNFANPVGLTSLGHNLFEQSASSGDPTSAAPGTDGRGTLQQGALEQSNVDVVSEMVGLIRAQRSYEINSKVIAAADQMLQNATQLR